MSDAMQIARQRRKEHEQAIAKRESEIEELREMIADLDSFLEFGQELISGPASQQRQTSRPFDAAPKPNEPQLKEVVESAAQKDEDKDDGEWSSEDPAKSIANVLAARKA